MFQGRPEEVGLECQHTIKSHGWGLFKNHKHDWLTLILLAVIEFILYLMHPFYRFVGEGMMTDLKYPMKDDTVPVWAVPLYSVLLPFAIFILYYIRRRDVYDLHNAILGILFAVLITGVLTDAIKNAVGRPRPDFFWRCFPDGNFAVVFFNLLEVLDASILNLRKYTIWIKQYIREVFQLIFDIFLIQQKYDQWGDAVCHGKDSDLKEGHKSFPSGHTSWSFAGLGFLSLYLSGKIKCFDRRGHVAKLCIIFLPILAACLVGISRVDDYKHHWQDVFAGGLLGLVAATFCYLQFFPPPYHTQGWSPYAYLRAVEESRANMRSTEQPGHEISLQNVTVEGINRQQSRIRGNSVYYNLDSTVNSMESGNR